jgi:hypothetical protein
MASPQQPHGFSEVPGLKRAWRGVVPADRPKAVIALNNGWANLGESLLRPIIVINQVSQFNVLILGYVPLMPGSPVFHAAFSPTVGLPTQIARQAAIT